ncbi:MAG: glycoside hydrolase family 15 protein [Desulfobacterales bacterium]
MGPYQPIENYGIIGDMHTAALVGMNGSIDWLCFPHFDSPSVFAAILDHEKGGCFKIAPAAGKPTCRQHYWPDTNVLITRFLMAEGVGEITDYMTANDRTRGADSHRHQVFRKVAAVRGDMIFRLECRPAFNYARHRHEVTISEHGAVFHSAELNLALSTRIPLQAKAGGAVAEFTLREGQTAVFVFQSAELDGSCPACLSDSEAAAVFAQTIDFWQRWLSKCTYTGRWREMVYRSALVLKLLTFVPTGAIIAAPTTSLPETIGGGRNWDYRYTWIRDAAFTLYGFLRIGFTDEAARFMEWLAARSHELDPDDSLQIMYSIEGRHRLDEKILTHLEGYRGSAPVRIGNAAYNQLQLDIYGELMDSVYLFNKYGSPISYELWLYLHRALDYVCDNWHRKDEGIWEVRSGKRHFVFSKLMCWVALDRGLRLAEKRSFPANRSHWLQHRDRIYEEIMRCGWNRERQAFVQSYESRDLDASNLLMPLVFFVSPNDPRMLKTLDAILKSPGKDGLTADSLVYRYNPKDPIDGLTGEEGSFNMCSFWLVEALTRAGRFDRRRLDTARLVFEQMLSFANHLGLYAEETGPQGEALGNFPLAFTHLALISAAFNLNRTLGS